MSETYGTFKARPRTLIGDTNSADYVIPVARLMELTLNRVQSLGSSVAPGTQWLGTPISLTVGAGDYVMPNAAGEQYNQIVIVRRQSDHYPLTKRTVQEQSDYWVGSNVPQGAPVDYAIWEDDSQVVNLRVRPVPSATDKLEVFYSDLPVLITGDSTVIPFSNPLIAALAKAVAIDCLAGLLPGQIMKLKVSPTVAQVWSAQVEEAVQDERVRLNRLKRIAHVQRVDR